MDIHSLYHQTVVPNYYTCLHPLIHEYLINHNKCSNLSLLINAELFAVPTCTIDRRNGACFVDFRKCKLLVSQSPGSMFGYEIHSDMMQADNVYDGLKDVWLNSGPVFASGTQYFLPHSANYKSPSYIEQYPNALFGAANHWVVIYEVHKDDLIIRDATAHYTGSICKMDFLDYWRGDGGIPELSHHEEVAGLRKYGYASLSFDQEKTEKDIRASLLDTLRAIVTHYLSGCVIKTSTEDISFGWRANHQLSRYFDTLAASGDSTGLSHLSRALLRHKFSRLCLRDLLTECGAIWPEFNGLLDGIQSSITDLQTIALKVAVYARRRTPPWNLVCDISRVLEQAHEAEGHYIEKICKTAHSIAI